MACDDRSLTKPEMPHRYFDQQCVNPSYEEETIKRAIQEVKNTLFVPS